MISVGSTVDDESSFAHILQQHNETFDEWQKLIASKNVEVEVFGSEPQVVENIASPEVDKGNDGVVFTVDGLIDTSSVSPNDAFRNFAGKFLVVGQPVIDSVYIPDREIESVRQRLQRLRSEVPLSCHLINSNLNALPVAIDYVSNLFSSVRSLPPISSNPQTSETTESNRQKVASARLSYKMNVLETKLDALSSFVGGNIDFNLFHEQLNRLRLMDDLANPCHHPMASVNHEVSLTSKCGLHAHHNSLKARLTLLKTQLNERELLAALLAKEDQSKTLTATNSGGGNELEIANLWSDIKDILGNKNYESHKQELDEIVVKVRDIENKCDPVVNALKSVKGAEIQIKSAIVNVSTALETLQQLQKSIAESQKSFDLSTSSLLERIDRLSV